MFGSFKAHNTAKKLLRIYTSALCIKNCKLFHKLRDIRKYQVKTIALNVRCAIDVLDSQGNAMVMDKVFEPRGTVLGCDFQQAARRLP